MNGTHPTPASMPEQELPPPRRFHRHDGSNLKIGMGLAENFQLQPRNLNYLASHRAATGLFLNSASELGKKGVHSMNEDELLKMAKVILSTKWSNE